MRRTSARATDGDGRAYYHGSQAGLRATEDAVQGVTGLKVDTYVMLNLKHRKQDVRKFVFDLEEWLIRALALFGRYSSERFVRDRAECWSRVSPSTLAARARAILGVDLRRTLTCTVPLLYLAGSKDIVVPRWNARALAHAIPSTRVVTIDGPHLALYTNPAAAADVLVEFIEHRLCA